MYHGMNFLYLPKIPFWIYKKLEERRNIVNHIIYY